MNPIVQQFFQSFFWCNFSSAAFSKHVLHHSFLFPTVKNNHFSFSLTRNLTNNFLYSLPPRNSNGLILLTQDIIILQTRCFFFSTFSTIVLKLSYITNTVPVQMKFYPYFYMRQGQVTLLTKGALGSLTFAKLMRPSNTQKSSLKRGYLTHQIRPKPKLPVSFICFFPP